MLVVSVTYTVHKDFIQTNMENISKFLEDFKLLDHTQFLYTIFQSEDGRTFVHNSQYANKEIQQYLLNIPSFLNFQKLRDKNLFSKPTITFLQYVGASKEIMR